VHPTKSEVKFLRQGQVLSVLGRAVRSALLEGADVRPWEDGAPAFESAQRRFELRPPTPGPRPPANGGWEVGASAWDAERSRWDAGSGDAGGREMQAVEGARQGEGETGRQGEGESEAVEVGGDIGIANVSPSPHLPLAPSPSLPPLRIVGQVGLTYIVAESPEGMVLIDQHAAHERITYERLMAQRGAGAVESQGLLLPQSVALPPAAAELLLRQAEALAEWGFAVEEFGEGLVRVRALPATLPADELQQALLEVADHLAGRGGSTPRDWREEILITLSCHTSVRAGQSLSFEEMRTLLRQLDACASPRTCPHGRPTMILLSPGQLERQFGRA
jgi:DNA mismatch repair protein MutL